MTTDSIGIHEAKTQFSKLIESVKKGRRITISQRGQPVAMLVPFDEPEQSALRRSTAIKQIRIFRKRQQPVTASVFEQRLKADRK